MRVLDIIQEATMTAEQAQAIVKAWLDKQSPEKLRELADAREAKLDAQKRSIMAKLGIAAVVISYYTQLWALDQMAKEVDPATGQKKYSMYELSQYRALIHGHLIATITLTAAARTFLRSWLVESILQPILLKLKVPNPRIEIAKQAITLGVAAFVASPWGEKWLMENVIIRWLVLGSGTIAGDIIDTVWEQLKKFIPDAMLKQIQGGYQDRKDDEAKDELENLSDVDIARRAQSSQDKQIELSKKLSARNPHWANPELTNPRSFANPLVPNLTSTTTTKP